MCMGILECVYGCVDVCVSVCGPGFASKAVECRGEQPLMEPMD